jgi:threonine dehydratase
MSEIRIPTYDDVLDAAARIAPFAVTTPLIESPMLNACVGGRVLLKLETLQRIGAFKFRGAYNALSRIDRARHPGGAVACSSGNHAQGVAEAARLLGMPAAIVMPSDAPRLKIERTRALGADVVLYDRVSEDREAIAGRLGAERGAAFIHPFDNPDIVAGQGTVGLELMRQAAAIGAVPDAVIAPASGGGLGSGVALAVKHASPATEVYLAEPAGFDDFARSLASGRREKNASATGSICDALMSQSPGVIAFEIGRRLFAGSKVLDDAAVGRAVRYAFMELKLVVEPGGVIGLAAVLEGGLPAKGRTVAVVLSGGNVDPRLFAELIGG